MITAHLATLPDRLHNLPACLNSLAPHVDHIYVALNGHIEIPNLDIPNVTFKLCDNNKGDAHKFEFINDVSGLVLITDDDLTWTKEGIDILVGKVEQYKCPCSLHGKKYGRPFKGFKHFMGNYRCLNTLVGDHEVDVIGTGTLMFDTSMVLLSMADFPVKNMADVWFSKICHEQRVGLMAVEHRAGVVGYLSPPTTIWQQTKDYSLHNQVIANFLKNNH
jgi:hypothetical protein